MADFVNDLEIAHQVYTIENVDVEDKTIKVNFSFENGSDSDFLFFRCTSKAMITRPSRMDSTRL